MSEEEKKAIDYLQLCYDLSTIDNESLPKLAIILNLITKQQEEIEIKNNKLNMLKENAGKLSAKVIVDIIENYTGFFGGKI